jgi:hypothetical protein
VNELLKGALKHVQAFVERYKDIGCQVCEMISGTACGRRQLKNHSENHIDGVCSRCPTVSRTYDERQLRIIFPLRKKNGPRKPEMFCIMFECCHLNSAWASADLYRVVLMYKSTVAELVCLLPVPSAILSVI